MVNLPVEWSRPAQKDLRKLDRQVAKRVRDSVRRYAELGLGDVRRLTDVDPPEYRLRVGAYRALFAVHEAHLLVLRVLHRKDAY
jgi:mRNA-degrading endonuclease RelE of RelBE toxin-antitoxin system